MDDNDKLDLALEDFAANKPKIPRIKRIARKRGDELRRHDMWILDSEFAFLRSLGEGNASMGLRRLVAIARLRSPE
jgi:hypothetical protein